MKSMKKIEQDNLIREIVSFCLDYGVQIDESELRRKIEKGISKTEFLEDLINTVFLTAKRNKRTDIKRAIELLLELERMRLELEFKDRL